MKSYHLEVTSEHAIPPDVLIEHLAVALREFKFAGKTSIALRGQTTTLEHKMETKTVRNHPFEGPEVFDDYFAPKPPTTGTVNEGSFLAPGAPGSFETQLPEDPYPLTTRVIDAIKETRRHGND